MSGLSDIKDRLAKVEHSLDESAERYQAQTGRKDGPPALVRELASLVSELVTLFENHTHTYLDPDGDRAWPFRETRETDPPERS